MFCPSCGVEDRQNLQFCRACGSDLRGARSITERPHTGSLGASTAREEIGRAVAAKIRDLNDAKQLKKFVDDVLPEVEKFLETPEEKRLRRMRMGLYIMLIGICSTIFFSLIVAKEHDALPTIGIGLVPFFIGLGTMLSGYWLTIPPSAVGENAEREKLRSTLDKHGAPMLQQGEGTYLPPPRSVIEHTTRELMHETVPPREPRSTGE